MILNPAQLPGFYLHFFATAQRLALLLYHHHPMRYKGIFIVLFALCCLSSTRLRAQGCSDAGFCTMGALKPDQPYNKRIAIRLRSMEISFYRGTTTLTPVIYVATADLNFGINDKTSFQ